ncbi:REX4 [Candida margitis]|uniref:REX4 n=1 Tax=Candida margitis TaxID=1775924 RepID=UPI0022271CF6|nr:REX4 [Candida margitis]KAI5967546.1 REX4 [Candida margitis]
MVDLSSNWRQLSSKIEKPGTKKSNKSKAKQNHIRNSVEKDKHLLRLRDQRVNNDGSINAQPLEYTLWTTLGNKEIQKERIDKSPNHIIKPEKDRRKDVGRILAIDCEFVGVGPEKSSALARVTIVNFYGHVIMDEYVKPRQRVTDWRTWVSGISPWHLKFAIKFDDARAKVESILRDKILVGHALSNDLEKLQLSHPPTMIRDTSSFPLFKQFSSGKTPSLKKLTKDFLDLDIQTSEHNPIEDARATMLLYRLQKNQFETFSKSRK